jgi:hypothetical protein
VRVKKEVTVTKVIIRPAASPKYNWLNEPVLAAGMSEIEGFCFSASVGEEGLRGGWLW